MAALGLVGAAAAVLPAMLEDPDPLGDRCRGTLPVEKAGEVLGASPSDLGVADGSRDPMLARSVNYWCTVQEHGVDPHDVPSLSIDVTDVFQDPGLDPSSADTAPLGHGWIGSHRTGHTTMLLSCPGTVSGGGLLVHVEHHPVSMSRSELDAPPDEEDVRFAAVAADIATAVGEEWNCTGAPGRRPTTLESSSTSRRPPAEASGTCAGLPAEQLVDAGVTAVTEGPAGQGIAETCRLHLGDDVIDLHAAYGPIDHPWGRSEPPLDSATATCPSPLNSARYVATSRDEQISDWLSDTLDAFAVASAERHDCDIPEIRATAPR
ncbi:hypothetical protein [Streptomyces marincola]|uniref:hypothetical protein n=1 Tax=Streptomyces marincola TaxID=2878388 RepID=UPI001CF52D13|nr:hypothetical protein [Streptomyces marincola]UCM89720.1 hypothetical protein LC193_18150 [Streptomyces marincola]